MCDTHKLADILPNSVYRGPESSNAQTATSTPRVPTLVSQGSGKGKRWAWNILYQKVRKCPRNDGVMTVRNKSI